MRRFATRRHQRMAMIAAVVGNVVPVILISHHQRLIELHSNPVVGIGTTLAVMAPIGVNALPGRHRILTRLFAYSGVIGLTMLQAGTGGVSSNYAILFVMPMLWFGLTASRAELLGASALVLACCLLPMEVFPQQYPRQVLPALALVIVALSVMLSVAGASREVHLLTDRLREAAIRDQLTGLLNRRGWELATQRALAGIESGAQWCVVLLDLDKLKVINDTLGHDEGDAALRQTGERLQEHLDGAAVVSRLGGDEFAALFVGVSVGQVLSGLEKLRRATPENGAFSAGVAAAEAGEVLSLVMRRADLALYQVKTTGRGRAALADGPIQMGPLNTARAATA